MLVEGRHFFADADPESLGHKTLAVNLSDIAAMGATPRWALLAGALPDADPAWLAAFARGFHALADAHGVDLVGGDTTRGPRNLCVTILGEVPAGKALRATAREPGDDIYVSGTLGDAALARGGDGRPHVARRRRARRGRARLERPEPRVALGHRAARRGVRGDRRLGRAHRRSRPRSRAFAVGAVVDLARDSAFARARGEARGAERALALDCLLAGGDDYELCSPRRRRPRRASRRSPRSSRCR